MVRLSLFTFVFLIGLSMIIAKNDLKFRKNQQKRFAQNNEQTRTLRNLVGKLIDTETNILYNVDGQKLQDLPLKSDVTTTVVPLTKILIPSQEEIACLAACNSCVEEYSLENVKFYSIKISFYFKTLLFSSARREQPIIVVLCVIVLTVVFACQSIR